MTRKSVAIVGAGGFIGKHLSLRLARAKDVDLRLYGKTGPPEGINLPYTRIDLRDPAGISEQLKGAGIIYYLVSETIPSSSWENPNLEIEKNLQPFITFLETVSRMDAKKIVFVSSAGTVYGQSTEKVQEETSTKPFSPYGIIKLAMEHFLNHYEVKRGLHYDIYRVSNVYGMGQNTSKGLGIINTFLEKITEHGEIQVYGNGAITRNYVYVKDVAELLSSSALNYSDKSGVYNLSSNDNMSITELVEVIRRVVKEEFKVVNVSSRQSDNPAIYLDNSKILRAHRGFRFTPLEQGIKETYRFIKEKMNLSDVYEGPSR